jgi:cephalosporin hydroxylase
MIDDRAEFEVARRAWSQKMRADEQLAEDALALVAAADRHHWSYQWSWLGVPVIQMPPDIVALQEVLWSTRPQLVIETGVARGGSLILSASILELLGEGEVLGIDIDVRPHTRDTIEAHPLTKRITLLEGSSIDPDVLAVARKRVDEVERVMVILDSDHTHDHVLAELRAYAPFVSIGQFLVVADTLLEDIPAQVHRPRAWGPGNNPATALRAWLAESDGFERDQLLDAKLQMTASPGGYLRRIG